MKKLFFLTFLFCLYSNVHAQLENVIIEKYYVSDAKDAMDVQYITDAVGTVTDSVFLETGSVTYRIYIQLSPGYMLSKVYGDANHALKFSSSAGFFNNISRGVSFGKDLANSRLQYNTVALDSWITLGLAGRTLSGVLKPDDTDGSIVGGAHNKSGMLANNDASAGIPLTSSDGLVPLVAAPSVWLQSGFVSNAGDDSTIFGSLVKKNQFISNSAFLQNSGVTGAISGINKVILAQLTTKGDISFELNIQVQKTDGSSSVNYVARRSPVDATQGNVYSQLLTFPQAPLCGCKDPDFLEYNPILDCNAQDSCKTKIVYGCMDPKACNFDPNANYSIKTLCCYPGMCSDRDISIVCPDLGFSKHPTVLLYPNPVSNELSIEVTAAITQDLKIEIYNSFGNLVTIKNPGSFNGTNTTTFDISQYENGIYLVKYFSNNFSGSKLFIKN